MKEERFFYVPQAATLTELPEEEAAHAVRVLRMKEGDEMTLMDGEGTFFSATVTMTTGKRCHYNIRERLPQKRPWNGHLHLAIAPTKMMERMEWMAEKATEVGIDELSFLDCRFSERHTVKTPRIEKIVVAAMKQSRKAWKPIVNEMQDFSHFIAQHTEGHCFIAHCYDEIPRVSLFQQLGGSAGGVPGSTDTPAHITREHGLSDHPEPVLVMVGPEGDFSIDEVKAAVDAGFISVDLGQSRLRTETAGLAAVMMMQLSSQ